LVVAEGAEDGLINEKEKLTNKENQVLDGSGNVIPQDLPNYIQTKIKEHG
jgi:hypothetical protein